MAMNVNLSNLQVQALTEAKRLQERLDRLCLNSDRAPMEIVETSDLTSSVPQKQFFIKFSSQIDGPRYLFLKASPNSLVPDYFFDLNRGIPKGVQKADFRPWYVLEVYDQNEKLLHRSGVFLQELETLYIAVREDGKFHIKIFGKIQV
jgi:hypothetical protein